VNHSALGEPVAARHANVLATLDAFRMMSGPFLATLPLLSLLQRYDPRTVGRSAH
jgi:hypothetical protein